jgi:glutaminyl-peptide cyclotransferase
MTFRSFRFVGYVLLLAALVGSCTSKKSSEPVTVPLVKSPTFNQDSAFAFVKKQVDFGPRVPNTPAHKLCGDYFVETLKRYKFKVTEQEFQSLTWDGKELKARNIIASYNPSASKRILLASHWDSRPVADQDSLNAKTAVPGANDGASGVGVLLEIARVLSLQDSALDLGVDIIFFDAEDWGASGTTQAEYSGFCLGANYWATHRHVDNYTAYFGVLLDMVGAKNATFLREGYSMKYAAGVVSTLWGTASKLGYDNYFIAEDGGAITDDHVPVNEKAKFPMVDIIHQRINNPSHTFFDEWHTSKDDMSVIDPATLKAVGQTLIQVLWEEAEPIQ